MKLSAKIQTRFDVMAFLSHALDSKTSCNISQVVLCSEQCDSQGYLKPTSLIGLTENILASLKESSFLALFQQTDQTSWSPLHI